MKFEEYAISIPPTHKPSEIEWARSIPDGKRSFVVTSRISLDQRTFVSLAGKPDASGTIGLFVHGYNNTYQEGLFRLAQIAVDSKFKAKPVLFSWPSQASVTGYVADRDAALFARDDLVRVVSEMSRQRGVKRVLLFGHSMGTFLIMESVRQIKLQGDEDVLRKLVVVLAAPDIDADVFRKQLEVIGPMKTPMTLFVSKDDKALGISSLIGGNRQRVGRLNVDSKLVEDAAAGYGVRVIDVTSLKAIDELGHDRYAEIASLGPQFAILDDRPNGSSSEVGAFVFDAAASVISSPFRLASKVVAGR